MSELVIIIRPSFMKFCKDGCRAALFNHLLFWIAQKNKDQSQEVIQSGEITYYATTEELTELMAGAWGSKKLRLEVNALVDMGLIGRGKNPKFGADRTKHFFFGKEQYIKLVELCKKHQVCLAHIGLPKEIINLLAAFSQSIECPCTKQMVNLPNANGQLTECSEREQMVKSPLANGKSTTAITKVSTKVSITEISNERKNGTRQPDVSDDESSIHSSTHQSSSQVSFSPEEEAVYQLAVQKRISALKRNKDHRDYCAKLASEGVTTLERIESLMQFCWTRPYLKGKDLYLKNLITELDGWLQIQNAPQVPSSPSKNQQPAYVIDQTANERRKAALRAQVAI